MIHIRGHVYFVSLSNPASQIHHIKIFAYRGRAAALPSQESWGVWGSGSPPSLMRGGLGGAAAP